MGIMSKEFKDSQKSFVLSYLQEAVLWMGSGSATSVLHKDGLDNIMCLMDGRKTFVLIDKVHARSSRRTDIFFKH